MEGFTLPPAFGWTAAAGLGLCLGSFATALAYRLPRGISMLSEARSACPACGRKLSAFELVPVFSYLFQRGRCRGCAAFIGWSYLLIELATFFLCLAALVKLGGFRAALPLMLLAPALTAMVDIDLRHKIIPDVLNAWILILGLARAAFTGDPAALPPAFLGMALYGGGALLLRHVFARIKGREPLGLGDVKFFAAAGAWLGPLPETAAAFMMISGIAGATLAFLWKRATGEEEFPFGPALALALAALVFF